MADCINTDERDDAQVMSDTVLKRLIEYLRRIGWLDSEIVELLDYIAGK